MATSTSRVGLLVAAAAGGAGVLYFVLGRTTLAQANQQSTNATASDSAHATSTSAQANKQASVSSGGLFSPAFSHTSDSSLHVHAPVKVKNSAGAVTSSVAGHNHGSINSAGRDLVHMQGASSVPSVIALSGAALVSIGYGAYLLIEAELKYVLRRRPDSKQEEPSKLLRFYVWLNPRFAVERLEKEVEKLFKHVTDTGDLWYTWPAVKYIMRLSPESVKSTMPRWIEFYVREFMLNRGEDSESSEEICEFQRSWEQWAQSLHGGKVFAPQSAVNPKNTRGVFCTAVGEIVRAGYGEWIDDVIAMTRWLWDQEARFSAEDDVLFWSELRDRYMASNEPVRKKRVKAMISILDK